MRYEYVFSLFIKDKATYVGGVTRPESDAGFDAREVLYQLVCEVLYDIECRQTLLYSTPYTEMRLRIDKRVVVTARGLAAMRMYKYWRVDDAPRDAPVSQLLAVFAPQPFTLDLTTAGHIMVRWPKSPVQVFSNDVGEDEGVRTKKSGPPLGSR